MTQEWIDVSIHTAIDSGELLGLLGDSHVQGAWEDQGVTHLYWSRDHWSGEQLGQVRAALDRLDPSGQSSGAVQVGDPAAPGLEPSVGAAGQTIACGAADRDSPELGTGRARAGSV